MNALLNLGSCPADQSIYSACKIDNPNCVADSQCDSDEKCCYITSCKYYDCIKAEVSAVFLTSKKCCLNCKLHGA